MNIGFLTKMGKKWLYGLLIMIKNIFQNALKELDKNQAKNFGALKKEKTQ